MSKSGIEKIGFVIGVLSAPIFLSSFFITDNKKAVKRRYMAVGFFLAGWAIEKGGPKLIKG